MSIFVVIKAMSASHLKPSFARALIVMAVSLLLLAGCKSSRVTSRRGSSGRVTRVEGRFDLEDYTKGISDPMAKALISEAQEWIGTRYLYGGDSREGTDCSGLVMRVYGNVCGVKIPRSTREQVRYCTKVARNKMQPGDLVFFGPEKDDDKVSHVGLYIGEGRMIHASSSRGVMVSGFDSGYWADRYFTGARVEGAPMAYANVKGGKRGRKNDAELPETPTIPAAASPELQGMPGFPEVASRPEAVSGEVAAQYAQPSSPTAATASAPSASTIDLLDLIINQKVDSIFTSQFAD